MRDTRSAEQKAAKPESRRRRKKMVDFAINEQDRVDSNEQLIAGGVAGTTVTTGIIKLEDYEEYESFDRTTWYLSPSIIVRGFPLTEEKLSINIDREIDEIPIVILCYEDGFTALSQGVEEFINEEREENLKAYHERKAELYQRYARRYVVIAKGKVQAVGESFDDLKDVALDANHRFIFKVEPKEKVRGTLRWPIKRK